MSLSFTVVEIQNIADIVKLGQLGKVSRSPVLYRGQNDDWPLVPKIARPWSTAKKDIAKVLIREKWLLTEFQRQGIGMDVIPKEQCDTLSIAQHHGLPTRLLDWTQNAVAALWFAVEGEKSPTSPVVWRFETDAKDFDDSQPYLNPNGRLFFDQITSPHVFVSNRDGLRSIGLRRDEPIPSKL